MIENIVIRKAKISDFNDVHKLVVQVHKLHLDERDDIYKDVDCIELMVWGFNENAIAFYENLGMNVKNLKFEQKLI